VEISGISGVSISFFEGFGKPLKKAGATVKQEKMKPNSVLLSFWPLLELVKARKEIKLV